MTEPRCRTGPSTRGRLALFLGLSVCLAAPRAFAQAAPAEAKQRLAELDAREEKLEGHLARELRRIELYLSLQDQLLGMQVTRGAMTAEQAASRLAEAGRKLFAASYGAADLDALRGEHRKAVEEFFRDIEGRIASSTTWPADRPASEYGTLARSELDRARGDHERASGDPERMLDGLARAGRVLAWTSGRVALPRSLDPFEGERDRVLGAVAAARLRTRPAALARGPSRPAATAAAPGPTAPAPQDAAPVAPQGTPSPPPAPPEAASQGAVTPSPQAPAPPASPVPAAPAAAASGTSRDAGAPAPPTAPGPESPGAPAVARAEGGKPPESAGAPDVPPAGGGAPAPEFPGVPVPGLAPPPVVAAVPPGPPPPAVPGATAPLPPPDVSRGVGEALLRARAHFERWQFREALAAYDEALRSAPPGLAIEPLVGRGRSLNALGDLGGAIAAYQAALREQPNMQYIRVWLAELWLASGDLATAQAALQEELRLFPSGAAWSYVGTLQLLQGGYTAAGPSMAEASRLDPTVLTLRYNNGWSLASLGQHRRALVEFASVLALDARAAGAHLGLGVSYARLGMAAQAIQALQTYLQSDKSSQWAQTARDELARLGVQAPPPGPPGVPPAPQPLPR